MRFTPILCFQLVFMPACVAAPETREDALAALAAGRRDEAVRMLRRQVAAQKPPEPALLCTLGRAERLAGLFAAAAETLARVPPEATCGRGAAFERADALLALGRAEEAAAIYEQLGAPALSADRDAATADWIVGLARRIFGGPEEDHPSGFELLSLALDQLRLAPERQHAIARELAEAMVAREARAGGPAAQAAAVLVRGLPGVEQANRAALIRLVARMLPPGDGVALLATLPRDAETLALQARLAAEVDAEWGIALRDALLEHYPRAEPTAAARRAQAWALAERGRLGAAPLLEHIVAGEEETPEDRMNASRVLATLYLRAGRLDQAVPRFADHLQRFPTDPARAQVEQSLDQARLAQARAAFARGAFEEAVAAYDAVVARDPRSALSPQAAYEAGLALRAAGQPASRRWLELAARWPGTPPALAAAAAIARSIAFDQGQPEAALQRLREMEGAGATELERLQAPSVAIETTGRQTPGRAARVRVTTRNLKSVEMRLHRVDAGAYLRAGGTPEGLPDLDVAVVAPDQRWRVDVPSHPTYRDHAFEVPVPDVKPGIYVVTAASDQAEASAVLLVSDLTLVARTAGLGLAAATFRGGRPVAARLLIRTDEGVTEVKTSGEGLYTGPLPGGTVHLLAEHDGAPALLALHRGHGDTPEKQAVGADLDRPAYLPGDTLRFRLVGRDGAAPLAGPYKVWLSAAGVDYTPARFQAGPFGTVAGTLLVPPLNGHAQAALRVLRPGAAEADTVATVTVAPADPVGRRIEMEMVGRAGAEQGATVSVVEADGAPAADVPVWIQDASWIQDRESRTLRRTDAAGRITLTGPPPGVEWSPAATIAGTELTATARRTRPEQATLRLVMREDVVSPGEGAVVRLTRHTGPVVLTAARLLAAPEPPPPPADPWVPVIDETLRDPSAAPPVPSFSAEEPVWQQSVQAGDAPLEVPLPALAPGHYLVRAVTPDGAAPPTVARLAVDAAALRVLGARDAVAGETLDLKVTGGPALVTVEGAVIYAATIADDLRWTVPPAAHGTVTITATAPDGRRHERTLEVDGRLRVTLQLEEAGDRWRVRGKVADGAGRPVRAEVALTALDEALVASVGTAAAVDLSLLLPPRAPVEAALARAGDLAHGAEGRAIAAALREETARAEEARRAERASRGELARNALSDVFQSDIPLVIDAGGLSTHGFGRGGGGGGGRGSGVARTRVGKPSVRGQRAIHGERAAGLWRVVETDPQGELAFDVPAPRRGARWHLSARAVTAQAFGVATLDRDTRPRIRLVAASPAPGAPGDRATLRATVINGAATPLEATVEAGDQRAPVKVPAGAATTVTLGEHGPGTHLTLRLVAKGGALDTLDWRFPVRQGLPDAEGRTVSVAVGPGGGPPLAWLALVDDPEASRTPYRAALAGRAALAAQPHAGPDAPALDRRVRLTREHLRGAEPSSVPREAAELLLFLAEARNALGVTRGEIDRIAERLPPPGADAIDRVALLHARAAAGASVDQSVVSRLLRDAPNLPPELSSQLARALLLLDRRRDAEPLIRGDGPHAALARRALGQPVDRAALLKQPPPPPGAHGRPEWIAALAAPAGKRTGKATVRLGDRVLGDIDLARGGALHAPVPAGPLPAVRTDNADAPLVVRHDPARPGDTDLTATRLPRGASGAPVVAIVSPRDPADCDSGGDPCRLALGDALVVRGDFTPAGWSPPAGLVVWTPPNRGDPLLRAVVPGEYTLEGLAVHDARGERRTARPLRLRVEPAVPTAGAVTQPAAARLAAEAADAGTSPAPWLDRWPDDTSWREDLLPRVAALRFEQALRDPETPQAIVERFEALRAVDPGANLGFEQVAAVARAYRATGAHRRAVDVWRAGLGAAFLAEAAGVRQVEDVAGVLASLQGLRALAERYPAVPAVEQALFHLPQRLDVMAGEPLPEPVTRAGITATDLRLMAAAWDREYLASWPESERRFEVGFHLVQTLLTLDAPEPAAEWAALLAARAQDDPLLDGLLYLRGVALSRARQDKQALDLFERVARDEFPQPGGATGPANSRDDARYAAARLYEARGETERARKAYEAAAAADPEAHRAAAALTAIDLTAEPLVKVEKGDVELPVTVINIDRLNLRAYRLDLRTLFVRDGGLGSVRDVQVAGVSPAWSGSERIDRRPYPRELDVELPLRDPGAYLVQVDGGGRQATALVVKSALTLDADDDGDQVRVRVRRGDRPAAGVEVRGASPYGIHAAKTDLRGVALLPAGSAVIAFDGEHYAFADAQGAATTHRPQQRFDAPAAPAPRSNVEKRLQEQLEGNFEGYERTFQKKSKEGIDANML